jgi:hypothetical protein
MPAAPWGQELDYKLMYREGATNAPRLGCVGEAGATSIPSWPMHSSLILQGDCRVKERSPALSLGLVNFSVDSFGVQRPFLKALACRPVLPGQKPN